MPVTPTSLLAMPIDYLANLLAASASFQAALGVSDATTAKQSIYYFEASDIAGSVDARPRAIIYWEHHGSKRNGAAEWTQIGGLMLCVELVPPANVWAGPGAAHNNRDEAIWFTNTIGAIELDLQNNSGLFVSGVACLNASEIDLVNGPAPCDEDDENQYFWGVEWRVAYP